MNHLYFLCFVMLSYIQQNNNLNEIKFIEKHSILSPNKEFAPKNLKIKDKSVKFLWREFKYDETIKDSIDAICINEELCKTLTDQERAALGYVATFIGNECDWDGDTKEDRSNLKCKILSALKLVYQCSDTHLGFLRQWFKNDKKSLKELEDCSEIPSTATIQDYFDEINLKVKDNEITISFKATGYDVREEESWNWEETDYFIFENDNIQLIKKDKYKIHYEHFNNGE